MPRVVYQVVIRFLIFGAIFPGAVLLSSYFLTSPTFKIIFYNALFTWGISFISGTLVAMMAVKKHYHFMMSLMGSMILKMLISLLFLYLMIRQFPTEVLLIVLSFFAGYLISTIFEVFQLLHNLRPHFKKDKSRENQ